VNLVVSVKRMVDLARLTKLAMPWIVCEDDRRVGASRCVRHSAGVDAEAGRSGARPGEKAPLACREQAERPANM